MTKKTASGVSLPTPPPEARPEKERAATRAIGIRLPAELADSVDAICEANQVTRSQLVRHVLAGFVADYEAGKVAIPTRTVTVADI